MISKQLLNYIEREDKLGKSKNEVEDILISAGWHKDAVSDAFDIYYKKGQKEETEMDDVDEGQTLVDLQGSDPRRVELEGGKVEEVKEDVKTEKKLEVKTKKKRVRSVFLIILSFVLGVAIMMVVSMYFLNKTTKTIYTVSKDTSGFEAQKIDDGKRIADVLGIQKSLESYYNEYKSYPENINPLKDVPNVSSELNYTYTPIGSPPQSYILNIEVKNTEDGEFKIDNGFMTLKNKQGTK